MSVPMPPSPFSMRASAVSIEAVLRSSFSSARVAAAEPSTAFDESMIIRMILVSSAMDHRLPRARSADIRRPLAYYS